MASVAQRGVCTGNVIYLNGTNAKWGKMKGIYWKYSRALQSLGHYYESDPHKNNVLTCHNCFFTPSCSLNINFLSIIGKVEPSLDRLITSIELNGVRVPMEEMIQLCPTEIPPLDPCSGTLSGFI